ncbi:MAG: TIGR02996 domain-containing protein [Archangiaceae bacterium]|nr:TIGR02996 domain-containing protein [Archangiaceae bacterium]
MAQHLVTQLERAAKALEKKPETALQALVAAWVERPLPELAALVERFEAANPPPAFEGDTKAFTKLAKKPTATQVGTLARAIVAGKTAETIERLSALTSCRDDPRVSSALLELIKLVPWTSDGARPVWTKTFELITRIADPRLLELAPKLPAEWKFREAQREWMQVQLRRAVEAVTATRARSPVAPLSKPEAKALDQLSALLKPQKKSATQNDAASLLAAIYANPDDDAARLVYADWCLERQDPHGEFITLQFKADKSKAESKREAELQKKHGATWLGALAKVTLKDVTFRRGFPSKVVARFKGQRDVEQAGDAPQWATIEDLSWSLPGAWSNDEARWLEYLPKHARPRTLTVHRHSFAQLLEAKTPWAIERLDTSSSDVEALRRFAASKLFPKVTWLRVSDDCPPLFLTKGWLQQVADLGVHTHNGDQFMKWLTAMAARERFTIEHRWAGSFQFTRGADGALSKLHLVAKPGGERMVLGVLNELPEGAFTEATAEGLSSAALEKLATLVRKKGVKAPVAEQQRVRFVAAHQHGSTWAVVREDAFVLTDEAGAVVEEQPINETDVAAFSPDGKTVACAWDRRIEWRDGATGALVKQERLDGKVLRLQWTRSGDRVVLHLENRVEVRAWPRGTVERTIKSGQYPKRPIAVALSDDGEWLVAAQYSDDVHVHGPGMKKPAVFTPPKMVTGLAFVSEHEVVASCQDDVLRRYDVRSPATPLQQVPLSEVGRLVQSPDGRRLAVGSLEAYVDSKPTCVLDALTLKELFVLEGPCKVLAFSADGTKLLTSDGMTLQVHAVGR